MTDEAPDLIREDLNFKYIKNNVAWEKFGEEFNQYKANYKKEAKERIKEYIKKNYADSKVDNNIKIDSSDNDYKTDAEIDNDIEYYIDNLIEYADAKKKDFDESKVKRDADGKFAKKNSKGNKSKDEPKDKKDADKKNSKDNDNGTDDIDNNNSKDKKQDKTKNKDKNKSNNNLDYGDLKPELHETFARLNTATKPAEYIFNNGNEYGYTLDDIKKISEGYDLDEKVFVHLNEFKIKYAGGHADYIDLTSRDNLKSDIEKFLYDFTCNSDDAKEDWGERWENEIKPQLKEMIKNSPQMKGRAYRYESPRNDGEEIAIGKKISFDCRSVSDDNEGFDVVNGISQDDYSNPDVIFYVFPPNTRGLNIQGCSVYPNQHEYLVDGDFIIESIDEEEDEFGNAPKIVYLKKAE